VTVALWWSPIDKGFSQGAASFFAPTGISGGGKILSVTTNPQNPAEYLAVCDMMGVYKTVNEGLSWQLIPTDSFAAGHRTQMHYAGTGQNQRIYGIRRFVWGSNRTRPAVSADGGVTWELLAQPTDMSLSDSYYSLEVDPAGVSAASQRLVVDNYRKLWFSKTGGTTAGSWTLIHQRPNNSTPDSIRLAGVAWDGDTIYVGTTAGVFVSTNNGDSWALAAYSGLPAGTQMVDFCGAKHPQTGVMTLFATLVSGEAVEGWDNVRDLEDSLAVPNPSRTLVGLYTVQPTLASPTWVPRTGPNGALFARVDVPANDSTRPWAVQSLQANNASVYRGVVTGSSWLWTRTLQTGAGEQNAGVTTGYQGAGGDPSWAWSYPTLGLDVADSDPDRVIISGDFPYLTDDGGQSWMQMYVNPATENPAGSNIVKPKAYQHSGLGVTTGHWVHWVNANIVLAASTDIGLQRSTDGGTTWTSDYTPTNPNGLDPANWYAIAKQPGSSRLYAAVSSINDFYEPDRLDDRWVNEETGDVLFSDDDGQTWASLSANSTGLPNGKFPGPVINVAVDPANSNHIYVACAHLPQVENNQTWGGIYRSTNGGAAWTKLADPPGTEGRPLSIRVLGSNELVVTYCARKVNGVHTASSGVFYSTNGGSSWVPRMNADMAFYTRDLVVDPSNSSRWFVAVQSTQTNNDSANPTYDGRGGVYRTSNKGVSWTRLLNWTTVPLAARDSVQSVAYLATPSPTLYVTTASHGLIASGNPLGIIPTLRQVNAFPFARARRVFVDPNAGDGTIMVTTQGGGLWRGFVEPTMKSRLVRTGANYEFQVDVLGTGGGAPSLRGLTNLAASPAGWTVLPNFPPTTSSLPGGGTRYSWANVNTHIFYSDQTKGYLRAVRARADGALETGLAVGWVAEQVSASTNPEVSNFETWGLPWLKPDLHVTCVSSLGSTLELDAPLLTAFTSGQEYYVEIAEGPFEGHRYEVDEAASTESILVLDLAHPRTTSSTAPVITSQRVGVREHWTLREAFPMAEFFGNNNPAATDEVLFWMPRQHPEPGTWQSHWLFKSGNFNQWTLSGDFNLHDSGGRVIAPGEGIFFRPRGTGTRTIYGWGNVRRNAFRLNQLHGQNFNTLGFPMDLSMAQNQMLVANGFLSSNNPVLADQVQLWAGDSTVGASNFISYFSFLNSGNPFWTLVGNADLIDASHSTLLMRQRAFFLLSRNVKTDWRIARPWVP